MIAYDIFIFSLDYDVIFKTIFAQEMNFSSKIEILLKIEFVQNSIFWK
jgi:hypothetical protein